MSSENVISFFFSSRRRHTRFSRDWSSDVCSSDLHLNITCNTVEYGGFNPVVANGLDEQQPDGETSLFELTDTQMILYNAYTEDRSEERRVGKEWRSGAMREGENKKKKHRRVL